MQQSHSEQMPATTAVRDTERRSSRSRRTRLKIVAALAGLLSSLAVMGAPGPASAQVPPLPDFELVPCPAGMTEFRFIAIQANRLHWVWEGYRYTLVSATPRFAVSDVQVLDNTGSDLDVENFTITSERSETHTISTTVGVAVNNVREFLNTNVSVNVVSSVTTRLGVAFTVRVPARTRFTAQYGVEVFDVQYYIEAWRFSDPSMRGQPPPVGAVACKEWGLYPQSTVAPTPADAWRLVSG
jgi:hypothetical protein